jgi:hypothetical protein
MATTTTTSRETGRKEATMATSTTPAVFTPGTSRWLSSLGHPGYGRVFAQKVWAVMQSTGCDAHTAIYGPPRP